MSGSLIPNELFELVVEWEDTPEPTTLTKIHKIVQDNPSCKIIDIGSISSGSRIPVSRAARAEELHHLSNSLKKVGGKTSIVRVTGAADVSQTFTQFYA